MKSSNYAYAVSRIRALEMTLLEAGARQRLLDAPLEQVSQLLQELGCLPSEVDIHNGQALENALEERLGETLRLLIEICPEPELFRWIARQYDVHNLKVLLRGHAASRDSRDENLFSRLGSVPVDHLRLAVREDQRLSIPEEMLRILDSARKIYEEQPILAALDVGSDNAYWRGFHAWTRSHGDRWGRLWINLQIDFHNLGVLLRGRPMEWPADLCAAAILEGGSLDAGLLRQLTNAPIDAAAERLSGTDYGPDFSAGVRGVREEESFIPWERIKHEKLMNAFHDTLYESLSSGPLMAYWLMRQSEVRFLRTLAVSKRCGLSGEAAGELQVRTHV